jgi:hypothetical protein
MRCERCGRHTPTLVAVKIEATSPVMTSTIAQDWCPTCVCESVVDRAADDRRQEQAEREAREL